MRDFLMWLKEMVGTGVVSPVPGPDYQIQGDPKASYRLTHKKKEKVQEILIKAVTEAAIAASKHIGSGDKLAIDISATNAMREVLKGSTESCRVVIGEGKKDGMPGLFGGENFCCGKSSKVWELAIDPVDGTRQVAKKNGRGAISVIAAGELLYDTEDFYMYKIVWGPNLDIKREFISATDVVDQAKKQLKRSPLVCMLDRPRHVELANEVKEAGGIVKFINDGDIGGAISTCLGDTDLLLGIGGSTEGVIAAAAVRCLGGGMLCFRDDEKLKESDLAQGEVMFAAAGIIDGDLLKGVDGEKVDVLFLSDGIVKKTFS